MYLKIALTDKKIRGMLLIVKCERIILNPTWRKGGIPVNVNDILNQVDALYEQNRGAEAEKLMQQGIAQAVAAQDDEGLLQLLNELLGYYRETSQVENSFAIGAQAIAQAKRMGLEGTIPYATTLLNVANAWRAGGRLQESLEYYLQVRGMYDKLLAPDNLLVASLENNISLLYQEMGNFAGAKECLLKALPIVTAKEAAFEIAVTHANLANTCIQLDELEEAYDYALQAKTEFEQMELVDAHYGAALSALGTYYYRKKDYTKARQMFERAMSIMETNLGRNEYYHRLGEYVRACDEALGETKGLALCREYYETFGKPMLEQQFGAYLDKLAVGLVGEGSDCLGYDDASSRDHDWGPDFCIWLTDETYGEIGEALQEAYEKLPTEFKGYRRTQSARGIGRRGVMTISSFYTRLLGTDDYEKIDWRQVSDAALRAAVSGEVYRDEEGIFSAMRNQLMEGYPEQIRTLKIAESAAHFSQTGQYNFARMMKRGDGVSAQMMLADCMRDAMRLVHYLNNTYPPHDKWLYRSMQESESGKVLAGMLEKLESGVIGLRSKESEKIKDGAEVPNTEEITSQIEQIGAWFADWMYHENIISDTESYLDAHTEELLYKASLAPDSKEALVEKIARLEFEAFDKVQNEGGRAECQNDWATFSIMRKSQYLTWNRTMLVQYLYDFDREYRRGHNLITEKYGRMMESTAPEEYEKLKENFPILTEEKKAIIEQIVQMQVNWMEEFAKEYPHLADNARSVHTSEDNRYNTSYETYLRGELGTYSDKMLELYGRYVVEHARENRNLTYEIMGNSVHLYGYKSLEDAERFLGL